MPPEPRRRLKAALVHLARDPSGRTAKLDVKRLEAPDAWPMFRLRLGSWRAVFEVREGILEVVRVFARHEGYDWLDRRHP